MTERERERKRVCVQCSLLSSTEDLSLPDVSVVCFQTNPCSPPLIRLFASFSFYLPFFLPFCLLALFFSLLFFLPHFSIPSCFWSTRVRRKFSTNCFGPERSSAVGPLPLSVSLPFLSCYSFPLSPSLSLSPLPLL